MNTIDYWVEKTPIGKLLVAATEQGVILVDCLREEKMAEELLTTAFSDKTLRQQGPYGLEAVRQLREYFAGTRKEFTCSIAPQGTDFQRRVWQGLCNIPYGTTTSYGQLSQRILGHHKGARAIGQANGKNPIAVIVPCHRVINKGGSLGGYSGGIEIKKWLLEWEVNNSG